MGLVTLYLVKVLQSFLFMYSSLISSIIWVFSHLQLFTVNNFNGHPTKMELDAFTQMLKQPGSRDYISSLPSAEVVLSWSLMPCAEWWAIHVLRRHWTSLLSQHVGVPRPGCFHLSFLFTVYSHLKQRISLDFRCSFIQMTVTYRHQWGLTFSLVFSPITHYTPMPKPNSRHLDSCPFPKQPYLSPSPLLTGFFYLDQSHPHSFGVWTLVTGPW